MTSSLTVLLSCFLLAVLASADMDNNQQMEQMMSNMMAAKMGEVEEKVQEMRAEITEKDREMEEMREEMREEMEKREEVMRQEMQEKVDVIREMREEMDEKDNKVKKQLDGLEARNTELTSKLREVDQKSLRDLPFVLTCAYKHDWSTPSATITYDRLTVDYNNSGRPGGGDGELDITTGKFTALTPGHYTVTYSGYARVDPGEKVIVQLMKNGQDVGYEGEWQSYCSSANGGSIRDQGSRTVVSV